MSTLLPSPVFLVGAERSGTTMLRLMLDAHPDLAFHQESEFIVDRIPEGGGWPSLPEYYEWLSLHRGFNLRHRHIDKALDYPGLADSFLRQHPNAGAGTIIGATVHRNFHRLSRIWPDARYIHLIRDGRDVARSTLGMGWAGNAWKGADRWVEAERTWEGVRKGLPPDRWIDVKYESIVEDPPRELDRLCRFIGIPYDAAMLDYPKTSTYGSPDPKFAHQWRTRMSEREVRQVESKIGTMLTERGYELSGKPALRVSRIGRLWLNVTSWHGRVQWRRRRFGTGLLLRSFLARRLGFHGWARRLRLEMNAITNRNLK